MIRLRLIISNYIRTLKERGEFDTLLPDLLNAMDIVPISRPSIGTRQFGVDLAAVGPDPDAEGERKLFLFVLKQGDISRSMWSSDSPQSVRPTLEEILDVYLKAHVPQSAESLPKKIVLSTTGDLREEVVPNWSGFTNSNAHKAEFDFWGADKLALLLHKNLLNENMFGPDDRGDFRRALALASEPDYNLKDFDNILLRQLGLDSNGKIGEKKNVKELGNALLRVNLATRILAGWSTNEGNGKRALLVTERALLWSWHRINLEPKNVVRSLSHQIDALWQGFSAAGRAFLVKIAAHAEVRDGLSGYTRDSRIFALVVFEVIGMVAAIGLAHLYTGMNDDCPDADVAMQAARIMLGIIKNNSIANFPQYDEHVIEISLAMSLLMAFGEQENARKWLHHLIRQYDYTMSVRRNFPIGTDSFDDLVEFGHRQVDNTTFEKLTNASWLLPTLAGWSVNLNDDKGYRALVAGKEHAFKSVTGQLWHPVKDDLGKLYYSALRHDTGEAEAPIFLPENLREHRDAMSELLLIERLAFVGETSAYGAGRFGIDFIAFRHFRTPVPAAYWYMFCDEKYYFLP